MRGRRRQHRVEPRGCHVQRADASRAERGGDLPVPGEHYVDLLRMEVQRERRTEPGRCGLASERPLAAIGDEVLRNGRRLDVVRRFPDDELRADVACLVEALWPEV